MKHATRRIATLVALVALATSAVGCSKPAAESADKPAAKAATVKLGFAAPLTGDNAVYGEGMKRAVELAIDEANASEEAKAKGITFDIHAEDDAGDPKQAVNAANALVGDTNVVGIVGHFNSGCSIPAAPVYDEANLAMVTVSSNPQLTATGLKNVNRVVAKDDAQGTYAGGLVADKLGAKKVVVIDDSTPYGQGLAAEFEKAFTGKGGVIVNKEQVQPKEVDFAALVTKIKAAKPDAIYYAGAHTEGALLTKQLREAGVKATVVGGDMLYTPEFIKIAGEKNAVGTIATSLGQALEDQPKGAEFKQKYVEKYGEEPQAYDSYAYDAARIIINAVLSAGAERAAVEGAVRSGTLADGVTGSISFDANGDNKEQVISAFKVEGAEWKPMAE